MAFSESVKKQAFERAHSKCENCGKSLYYGTASWHAHHIKSQLLGGLDTLGNCRILCVDCHEKTHSYGKH